MLVNEHLNQPVQTLQKCKKKPLASGVVVVSWAYQLSPVLFFLNA